MTLLAGVAGCGLTLEAGRASDPEEPPRTGDPTIPDANEAPDADGQDERVPDAKGSPSARDAEVAADAEERCAEGDGAPSTWLPVTLLASSYQIDVVAEGKPAANRTTASIGGVFVLPATGYDDSRTDLLPVTRMLGPFLLADYGSADASHDNAVQLNKGVDAELFFESPTWARRVALLAFANSVPGDNRVPLTVRARGHEGVVMTTRFELKDWTKPTDAGLPPIVVTNRDTDVPRANPIYVSTPMLELGTCAEIQSIEVLHENNINANPGVTILAVAIGK